MLKTKNIISGFIWALIFQVIFIAIVSIGLSIFLSSKGVSPKEINKFTLEQIRYYSNMLSIVPIYLAAYLTIRQRLPGTKSDNWESVDELTGNFDISAAVSLILMMFVIQCFSYVGINALFEALKYKSAEENKYGVLVSYGLCLIISYLFFNRQFKINLADEIKLKASQLTFIPVLLMVFISEFVITSELDNIGSKYIKFRLMEMTMLQYLFTGGVLSILVVAVIGPVFEEYFFRRIIFRNFLNSYSPVKAIIITSLLFACVHLNLQAFLALFFAGIVLSTIFYLTGNLLYCIILHGFHNLFVYLFYNKIITIGIDGFQNDSSKPQQIVFQPLWIDLAAVGLLVFTILVLYVRKNRIAE